MACFSFTLVGYRMHSIDSVLNNYYYKIKVNSFKIHMRIANFILKYAALSYKAGKFNLTLI